MDILESAKSGGGRKGKACFVKYLQGGRLTQRQAIQAKCYDCDGMGSSGRCDIETCSLYPYSPFASKSAPTSTHGEGTSPTMPGGEMIAKDTTGKG